MASINELVALLNNGETGKLLARTFNGERGRTFPNQDSEVMVVFKSETETPGIKPIIEVVTKHYSDLGYKVESRFQNEDSFEAFIFFSTRDDAFVGIVITTHYPFPSPGQGRTSLRLTSQII